MNVGIRSNLVGVQVRTTLRGSFRLGAFVAVAACLVAITPSAEAFQVTPALKKAPSATPKTDGKNAIIKVDEVAHDFGTIWAGPRLTHSFKIKNEGKVPLEIKKVKPSCGCTIAGPYPKTIQPGETGEFPFALNSEKLRGRFRKAITIGSNDPVTPNLRLTLEGEVKQYIAVVPTHADFGRIASKEPQERVVTIVNNTDNPLELTLEPPKDDHFKFELIEKVPGKKYDVRVTVVPTTEPGVLRSSVKIRTNVAVKPVLTIAAVAIIPERLEVLPTQIIWPGTNAGGSKGFARIIRFNNYGDHPVKVLEVTASDPSIDVQLTERVAGKDYYARVKIPAGFQIAEGENPKITFLTDDKEKPSIDVPITSRLRILKKQKEVRSRSTRRPAEGLVGNPVPTFSASTIDGKPVSNITVKSNKVTILDFFAVNCGFCKKQIPRLEKVRKEFAGKDVRFIAVSQTMRKQYTNDETLQKLKDLKWGGEVLLDRANTIGPVFKATSFPTMVVLGSSGKVEAVNVGNVADLETRLSGQIQALLAGKPIPVQLVQAKKTAKPAKKRRPSEQRIGKPAPSFSLKTRDGKDISNATIKNEITVLDFFAVNCGYCGKQIPRLESIRQKYQGKGVRFVAVSQTMRKPYTDKEVAGKLTTLNWNGEVSYDPQNTTGPLFGASGFPTMVVLGKSGNVEAVNVGNMGDLETRLAGQLDALLAGKPIPAKFAAKARPKARKTAASLVGKDAPKFSIKTIEGKEVSNADCKTRKATVLNFVAPNCGYCKKQLPMVETIRAEYEAKGIRFVNVSQTMRTPFTPEKAKEIFDNTGAKFELAMDDGNKVGRAFLATSYPTMVIVGENGKILAVNSGARKDIDRRTKAQLDAALSGKPMPVYASAPKPKPSSRRPAQDLVGKPAPQFTLKTVGGKTFASTEFSQHPATVLNFVAPNCGFCKRQLPKVESVRAEYEAKGVRFVNVSQTMRKEFTEAEVIDVFKKVGSRLELATDKGNKVGNLFKAVSFPTMIVVDKKGMISHVNIGAKPDIDSLLKKQLDGLIKKAGA